jgi:hypothetical protein
MRSPTRSRVRALGFTDLAPIAPSILSLLIIRLEDTMIAKPWYVKNRLVRQINQIDASYVKKTDQSKNSSSREPSLLRC